jgi:hypothetical protein
MQTTVFARPVAAELSAAGSLGFPDLPILQRAQQIVIGGPSMLAVAYGSFPLDKLRAQAAAAHLTKSRFQSAELWISSDPETSSVAYISERLLLVGPVKSIEQSIVRVADPKNRAYSPLMARAARYAQEDLWVVASRLPDPLASMFLPFEIEATAFEGSVSAWEGLHVVASIERATPMAALDFADWLAESLANRPAMAEGTEISTKERSVLVRMDLDEDQLYSSMRLPEAPQTAVVAAAAKPQAREFVAPAPHESQPLAPASVPVEANLALPSLAGLNTVQIATPMKVILPPPPPQRIRILGLEGGTREIPLAGR